MSGETQTPAEDLDAQTVTAGGESGGAPEARLPAPTAPCPPAAHSIDPQPTRASRELLGTGEAPDVLAVQPEAIGAHESIQTPPSIHQAEPGKSNGWMEEPEAHQHRIAVEQNAEDLDLLPERLRSYLIHDRDLVRLDGKALKKQGLSFKKLFAQTVLIPGRSDPALLQEAREFIRKREWLGTLAQQTTHIFCWRLRPEHDPAETLVAVLTFSCPGAFSTGLVEDAARVEKLVSRGACISWAPKHLPSHMLSDAIDWMVAHTDARCFVAYGDPAAGERGKVYSGANWLYLGADHGADVEWFHPSISPEKGWLTDRDLRHVWTYKLYAQRAGVRWDDRWVGGTAQEGSMVQSLLWDRVPPDFHRQLKEEEAKFKTECFPLAQLLKHKFVFVKGRTPAEDKALWGTLLQRRPDLIARKQPSEDEGWMDGEKEDEAVHEPCFANHIMRFVYRQGGQVPISQIRENGGLPKPHRTAASLRQCLAHLVRDGYLIPVKFNRTDVSVVERGAVPFPFTTPEREREADALRAVVRRTRLRLEAEFLIGRVRELARQARAAGEPTKAQRFEDEARALIVARFPEGVPQDCRELFDPPPETPQLTEGAPTEQSEETASFEPLPEQPVAAESDTSPPPVGPQSEAPMLTAEVTIDEPDEPASSEEEPVLHVTVEAGMESYFASINAEESSLPPGGPR